MPSLFTFSLAKTKHVLKELRSHLVWAEFIVDLVSGLLFATGCVNHHKRNDWVVSLIVKVNYSTVFFTFDLLQVIYQGVINRFAHQVFIKLFI